jgi:hypothetical protein
MNETGDLLHTYIALLSAHYGTVRLLLNVHVRRSVYGLRGPAFVFRPMFCILILIHASPPLIQDGSRTRKRARTVLWGAISDGRPYRVQLTSVRKTVRREHSRKWPKNGPRQGKIR